MSLLQSSPSPETGSSQSTSSGDTCLGTWVYLCINPNLLSFSARVVADNLLEEKMDVSLLSFGPCKSERSQVLWYFLGLELDSRYILRDRLMSQGRPGLVRRVPG